MATIGKTTGGSSRGKLLLVEDNPNDEAQALRSLDKAGLRDRVVITRDGEEALHYLFAEGSYSERDARDLPIVVLLNLKLPKVDGLVVLQRLRANRATHTLPVVVLTSSDEARDLAESYRHGANSYARKPVDYAEYSKAMVQVAEYWLDLNMLPSPAEEGM